MANSVNRLDPDIRITEILDEIAGDFCQNYCKWPAQYIGEDGIELECKLTEEHCSACPLRFI